MTKICIVFNHFQISDGVCRAAVNIANIFGVRDDVKVCLRPLFRFDKKMLDTLHPKIEIKPTFGFYFKGFSKLIDLIPDKLLYHLLIREKYDIEIGFCYSLPIKIIAASNNKAAKHFLWMHGYINFEKYYKKADKVICVSKCNAERLFQKLNYTVPVEYCYNPIDDKRICEQGEQPIEIKRPEGLLFVSVGRLSPEKGYSRLLDCVFRLKKEGYLLHLWLIGDGPLYNELIAKTEKLDINDIVYFAGEQRNPHAYTAKADIFICSSFSEGYSTVSTEAVILGVPVLTTNVSGGGEIIEDAQCGMLVGLDDESLYQGMKDILDHPEKIAEWKKTLEKTKAKFSYETRKKKLLSVLGLDKTI